MPTSAAILAGGAGRRLGGVNKALIEIGGRRVLDAQLAVVGPLVDEVLLVVADARGWNVPGARLVVDEEPGLGPLGGLATAWRATAADTLLLFACDLPFLDAALITRLRDSAPAAAAVVPRVDGRAQPLHGCYRRAVEPVVRTRLARRALRMLDLLADLDIVYIDLPPCRGLTNLNTPDDVVAAELLLGGEPP